MVVYIARSLARDIKRISTLQGSFIPSRGTDLVVQKWVWLTESRISRDVRELASEAARRAMHEAEALRWGRDVGFALCLASAGTGHRDLPTRRLFWEMRIFRWLRRCGRFRFIRRRPFSIRKASSRSPFPFPFF